MKYNVEFILRERGKIVLRRRSHNIWASAGQYWLTQLVSEGVANIPMEDNRLRYIGFGVGGYKQSAGSAFVPPLSVNYPGTNLQTNIQYAIPTIERPCRISPGVYLKQFDLVDQPTIYSVRFTTSFANSDISYDSGDYKQIPISEAGLFANGSDLGSGSNPVLGYDVFGTFFKSNTHDMTVTWTIRF